MKKSKLNDFEALLVLENLNINEKDLLKLLNVKKDELDKLVEKKNQTYKKIDSILRIVKKEDSYALFMDDSYTSENIKEYLHKKKKLPNSVLETLSIIAYKQPITRVDVDDIRGVNCTNQIKYLLDEELIISCGKKDSPGKPILFKTTERFLSHFGIKSLKDLPPIEEIKTYSFLND